MHFDLIGGVGSLVEDDKSRDLLDFPLLPKKFGVKFLADIFQLEHFYSLSTQINTANTQINQVQYLANWCLFYDRDTYLFLLHLSVYLDFIHIMTCREEGTALLHPSPSSIYLLLFKTHASVKEIPPHS